MTRTLNIAHRGGALLWPENTLFAFANAARAGYDGAELDVQLTRDGKLAVFHDFRLKPELCRDAPGHWLKPKRGHPLARIRDCDMAHLRALDVGRARPGSLYARSHRRVAFTDGQPIPTLGEVIAAVSAIRKDFLLFIEIKTCAENRSLSSAPEAVAEAVVHALRAAHFRKSAVLVGFDWPALVHAKRLDSGLCCWFTTQSRRVRRGQSAPWAAGFDPWKYGSIPVAIKAAGGEGWFASKRQARPEAVAEAKRLGLAFGVWTVDRVLEMRGFRRLGADAICTDRPDRLAALVTKDS
jgi:glycerophosphoryl diester phosphodiesterase